MKYESIADIYSANEKVRGDLKALAVTISAEEAAALPDGEKWTIAHLFEHVAIVNEGISKIAAKLVAGAQAAGKPAEGSSVVSPTFFERTARATGVKVEAPERVHPTGEVAIADSLARLEANIANYEALRSDLESFDTSAPTFSHPFFGELTAPEWMIIAGAHEARHATQIGRILGAIRQ